MEVSLIEPLIIDCDGCGIRIRIRRPDVPRSRECPRCRVSLDRRLVQQLAGRIAPDIDVSAEEDSGDGAGSQPRDLGIRRPWNEGSWSGALPRAYAASLIFLAITAVLFAQALNSLGADEPAYAYRLRGYRGAAAVFTGAATAQSGENPTGSSGTDPSRPGHESAALVDFPDCVFAEATGLAGSAPSGNVAQEDFVERTSNLSLAETGHKEIPRRIKIRDEGGRLTVARLHGEQGGKTTFILPDGQLGLPNRHIRTDEPFRPLSSDELLDRLKSGVFSKFQSLKTEHYLIFFQSDSAASREFAEQSGTLLENLYKGLTETFRKRGIPVHEVEFPMVVGIFESEKEFRAHKKVAPDVQAYYEIFTNRIYFYETSERDRLAPEFATLRRPQTVAHEGTHQILANIGVQPRLGEWPIWLTEGLAEYCASPVQDRKGNVTWNGLGMINAIHMATIRDLEDPRSMQVKSRQGHASRTGRDPGKPLLESLIRAEQLSPTDYALAWALTHYLALKRGDDFVKFLIEMSKVPPLEARSADDHVSAFKKSFGSDLAKLDKQVAIYLGKLSKQKGYDHLPYYAVTFEQPIGPGSLRRAAMVSQSPSVIQQWIQEMISPRGASPSWHAVPHSSRSRAAIAAEQFMSGY